MFHQIPGVPDSEDDPGNKKKYVRGEAIPPTACGDAKVR
jgi:hypothetical protein